MYKYVEDKLFLKRAQSCCSGLMKELEEELRNNYSINTQFFLVGSGGRNMITQNENESIDFDYNLNIISCGESYDSKTIKELIKKAFNKVMKDNKLNDVSDSTSCLTTELVHFTNYPNVDFSIDLAIVTKNKKGLWERLIHQKTGRVSNDKWIWNEAPNSSNIKEKSDCLKENNLWNEVRKTYLNKKNMYLKRNDFDHSSFICYIESVNEIYYKYFD